MPAPRPGRAQLRRSDIFVEPSPPNYQGELRRSGIGLRRHDAALPGLRWGLIVHYSTKIPLLRSWLKATTKLTKDLMLEVFKLRHDGNPRGNGWSTEASKENAD